MGMHNTIHAELRCPYCADTSDTAVVAKRLARWFSVGSFSSGVAGGYYRGYRGWRLMASGNEEAIGICINDAHMDCDPTHWKRVLCVGLVSLLVSLSLFSGAARLVRPPRRRRARPLRTIVMGSSDAVER